MGWVSVLLCAFLLLENYLVLIFALQFILACECLIDNLSVFFCVCVPKKNIFFVIILVSLRSC